jgi:hypothetical protein
MSRAEWLRKRFEASVEQGIGSVMKPNEEHDLGCGIFSWDAGPTLRVFERGFTYDDGTEHWHFRYDELTDLDLLDLRALMEAQKTPHGLVEFAVMTNDERRQLRLPLMVYTTFSSVLDSLPREEE